MSTQIALGKQRVGWWKEGDKTQHGINLLNQLTRPAFDVDSSWLKNKRLTSILDNLGYILNNDVDPRIQIFQPEFAFVDALLFVDVDQGLIQFLVI